MKYIPNILIWLGDENNVARRYPKTIGCGPLVRKVAHPWPKAFFFKLGATTHLLSSVSQKVLNNAFG